MWKAAPVCFTKSYFSFPEKLFSADDVIKDIEDIIEEETEEEEQLLPLDDSLVCLIKQNRVWGALKAMEGGSRQDLTSNFGFLLLII